MQALTVEVLLPVAAHLKLGRQSLSTRHVGEQTCRLPPKKVHTVPTGQSRVSPGSVQPRVQKPPGAFSHAWPGAQSDRDSQGMPTVVGWHAEQKSTATAPRIAGSRIMGRRP